MRMTVVIPDTNAKPHPADASCSALDRPGTVEVVPAEGDPTDDSPILDRGPSALDDRSRRVRHSGGVFAGPPRVGPTARSLSRSATLAPASHPPAAPRPAIRPSRRPPRGFEAGAMPER